jgi:hypothetical protein
MGMVEGLKRMNREGHEGTRRKTVSVILDRARRARDPESIFKVKMDPGLRQDDGSAVITLSFVPLRVLRGLCF